jgi:hypothetical protein
MRAHQPGSTPVDIPETVPNPAYTPAPAPAPAPERAPTKVPEKVPEKVIAPESSEAFFYAFSSTAKWSTWDEMGVNELSVICWCGFVQMVADGADDESFNLVCGHPRVHLRHVKKPGPAEKFTIPQIKRALEATACVMTEAAMRRS